MKTLTPQKTGDMWLRIAKRYDFDFTPESVVTIRKHSLNMQRNALHMLANESRLFEKWIDLVSAQYPRASFAFGRICCFREHTVSRFPHGKSKPHSPKK